MLTPAATMMALEAIDKDLQERLPSYEHAAEQYYRLLRDWEKRLAVCARTAAGPNAEVRKAVALVSAIEMDDLYERYTEAEARYNALKVVMKTLEARATIGQSLLRAQGRGA